MSWVSTGNAVSGGATSTGPYASHAEVEAVRIPLATGSTTARALADRFADVVNVKDFGAKCDGVTDDRAALVSMIATLGSANRTLTIPDQLYLSAGATITIPSNLPVRFEGGSSGFVGPGAGQVSFVPHGAPNWYVDSVNGNDSNSGRLPSKPYATISKLLQQTIPAGANIYLARGSKWRAQLGSASSPLPDGVTIKAYGFGSRPLLDASDVVGSWTKTGGFTNVYQFQAVPDNYQSGKDRWRVWENGVLLAYVADQATCDATPGSWTGALTATGVGGDTLYVHASDNGNPASNGKLYEYPKRDAGLYGGQYQGSPIVREIVGIHARRNLYDDGALVSAGFVKDCIGEDGGGTSAGPPHSFWVNGICEDCWAIGQGGFISFDSTGTGKSVWYRRAHYRGLGRSTGTGFYVHTGGGGSWDRIIYEDCDATDASVGWGGANIGTVIHYRTLTRRVTSPITSNATKLYVLGATLNSYHKLYEAPTINRLIDVSDPLTTLVVRGTRFIANEAAGGAMIYVQGTGTKVIDVQRSTFAWPDHYPGPPGYQVGISTVAGVVAQLTVNNSVFHTFTNYGISTANASSTLTANNNIYPATALFVIAGTAYGSLALYQAGVAPQEANSTANVPTFVGQVRNGDTRVTDGSADVWSLEAGADVRGDDLEQGLQSYFLSLTAVP